MNLFISKLLNEYIHIFYLFSTTQIWNWITKCCINY
uniref:Uncharacterized protein n=1 Tax=Lepeophtheirus salmonis TaxID=72036 RepID=A0A0K2TCL8_LEPSM